MKSDQEDTLIPVLPLRDVVVYPGMVIPLFVGRARSIKALEAAAASEDKKILLVAQRNPSIDEPEEDDVYRFGTVSTVLQSIKLPDGTMKVLVEGEQRSEIKSFMKAVDFFSAVSSQRYPKEISPRTEELFRKSLLEQFDRYAQVNKKIPAEVTSSLADISEVGRLSDAIAAHISLELNQKQELLELVELSERIEQLMAIMEAEIDLQKIDKKIKTRVKQQMEKSQREYYLNEQMKAIQKEMGELENSVSEIEQLEKRVSAAKMPAYAREKVKSELNKLRSMSPMSAEASVVRGYIDWMINIPWSKRSKVTNDLGAARNVLDHDHYGLDEVKRRILEFLAVQKRVRSLKGPVLCLVGPPGVGKTSLGESIARATNRKFVRMALGGVRDEAEIRGHRRTYVGSMPGKLLQKMVKAGVKNPLFMLDEIDKMGMDYRGDPASALLEVLDPEQNHLFNDHYIEVDYDLSEVMFICTSNSMNIPPALLDRMEIIQLPGYTEEEKISIAERHLLPKQMKASGLKANELTITTAGLKEIIRHYTREAGVRSLERQIAKICRKVIYESAISTEKRDPTKLDADGVEHFLGVQKFRFGRAEEKDQIGQVSGLAWTQVGGEILTIEAASVPGKGKQLYTGSLGDVMQESIQAAFTVVRSRAKAFGISEDFYEKCDVHIHVPEGATPKDGPSAGIGMCVALVSVLTTIPVRADVAMTGEITLRGQVLAIGGLKEKLLAAHRAGIRTVIIPFDNQKDLKEIPDNIKSELEVRPVRWIDEVLQIALTRQPLPLSNENREDEIQDPVIKKAKRVDKKAIRPH
ncbi:MAG: endopeptidase La [Pseudomonadales bacterium]|nr:endopeptidase La [Pseudomonadales bacterium]